MKLKLLHLYDDVMNLYGEYANVAVLARYLTDLGHSVAVDTLSLYEEKNISGYDFYYMGAGTERRQKLALTQLKKYAQPLRDAVNANKVVLFTGNAFELLGKSVTDADGNRCDCLELFDFESVEGKRRITGDVLATTELFPEQVVGFMNKCSRTDGIQTPLFQPMMGFGNSRDLDGEGFREKNCFGTHLAGPLLVKNPAMLRLIAKLLLQDAYADTVRYPAIEAAYETTAAELNKRFRTLK